MKTTPLRQQLIKCLILKGRSPRTIESYVGVVAKLAKHYHRSPDLLSDEEIRQYLYHLHTETEYAASTINVAINGLRFFYATVLDRPLKQIEYCLPRFKKPVRRPQAYSLEEVHQLLEKGFIVPKYRTFFMTLYGCGLRINEACHLKVRDIDSARKLVRVEQGKGKKDRYTILPAQLIEELRSYYRTYRPKVWLFEGTKDPQEPIQDRVVQCAFQRGLKRAGLPRKGGPHSLRHSWATHLIDSGTPLHIIKRLLGHSSVTTTLGYIHMSKKTLETVGNPLDSMSWNQPSM